MPDEFRTRYRTALQTESRWLIAAAVRPQRWIDRSQSLNLVVQSPDMKTLSHMYRHAWRTRLKTTYYLRSQGASSIEKSTVSAADSTTGDASAPAGVPLRVAPVGASEAVGAPEPAPTACSLEARWNGETREACEACE